MLRATKAMLLATIPADQEILAMLSVHFSGVPPAAD